jgi:hypothetical protein
MNNSQKMHVRGCASFLLIAVGALLTAAGCGGSDARSLALDPTAAKQSLEKALTAWKSGQTPDSLKTSDPAIVVGDWSWSQGYKLTSFKVLNEKSQGPNLCCTVELVVAAPKARAAKQTASYTVTTSPQVTVIRDDV